MVMGIFSMVFWHGNFSIVSNFLSHRNYIVRPNYSQLLTRMKWICCKMQIEKICNRILWHCYNIRKHVNISSNCCHFTNVLLEMEKALYFEVRHLPQKNIHCLSSDILGIKRFQHYSRHSKCYSDVDVVMPQQKRA